MSVFRFLTFYIIPWGLLSLPLWWIAIVLGIDPVMDAWDRHKHKGDPTEQWTVEERIAYSRMSSHEEKRQFLKDRR